MLCAIPCCHLKEGENKIVKSNKGKKRTSIGSTKDLERNEYTIIIDEHYVFPTPCTHLCSNTSMICYFNTLWGSFCFRSNLSLKTISIQGMYSICNCITKHSGVSKSMDDKLTLSYYTPATSFDIFSILQ